jgi:hypothetical protein
MLPDHNQTERSQVTATELLAFAFRSNKDSEIDSPYLTGFSAVGLFDGFSDYKSLIEVANNDVGGQRVEG